MFRIGARPLHTKLFAAKGGLTEQDLTAGTRRTAEEVDVLKTRIAEIVDEVGGKVCLFVSSSV